MSIYEYDEEKHMRQEREYSTEKGIKKVNTLIIKLSELGRTDDIIKVASDSEYQKKLFEEFGL